MRRQSVQFGLVISSLLILASCSSDSGGNKAAPAVEVQVADANGRCMPTTEADFILTAQAIQDYQTDPSPEKLTAADNACKKFQSFMGDKSCATNSMEPEMQLSQETMAQPCLNISDKVEPKNAKNKAVFEIDQVLNSDFKSVDSKKVEISVAKAESGNLGLSFTMSPATDLGVPFEVNVSCAYFSKSASMMMSHSTSSNYGGEKTYLKQNGDIVRICGKDEVKVGQKSNEGLKFKIGSCGTFDQDISNALIDITFVTATQMNARVDFPTQGKVNCSGELEKVIKK